MTPDLLREVMKDLSLNSSDVGVIAGCTDRQVRSWLSGRAPVPRPMAAILIGLRDGEINRDWLVDAVMSELRQEADAQT